MDQQLFESIVYDLKENIEKKQVSTAKFHLDYPSMTLRNAKDDTEYLCAEKSVRSQLLGLINSGVNVHLGGTLSKLYGDGVGNQTDPIDHFVYDPKELGDDLLRYCELNRKENIYVLNHKVSNNAYGIVSGRHVITQDADVYDMQRNIFRDIPNTTTYQHNYFRFMIQITCDEIAIELEDGNKMKLRINLGGSMFGYGSAFIKIGSYEKICMNGAMGWKNKLNKIFNIPQNDRGVFDWRKRHTYSADYILKEMEKGIIKQLSYGDVYMQALQEAHEANEPLFKENTKIDEELTKDRFKLTQQEAGDVYKLLLHKHKQYSKKNAFDVGRAIAEVARDTPSLDRRIELEQLAGETMLMQVAT